MSAGAVHVYTGDGKGKTTAAVGLAVRAAGAGLRVLIVHFLKGLPASEHAALEKIPGITIRSFGRKGFIRGAPSPRDRAEAAHALHALEHSLASGGFHLVVADELVTALSLDLVAEADVLDLLAKRPPGAEVVLTGRGATRALVRAADLVTEMKNRKHYYARGRKAKKGIEY